MRSRVIMCILFSILVFNAGQAQERNRLLDASVGTVGLVKGELKFNISATALFSLDDEAENSFYLGAGASYETALSGGGGPASDLFGVGPRFEYHHAINSWKLNLIGGLRGDYYFGSNSMMQTDFNTNGWGGELYTGLSFRITDGLDLGVTIPLVTHRNLNVEAETPTTSFSYRLQLTDFNTGSFAISAKIDLDGGSED